MISAVLAAAILASWGERASLHRGAHARPSAGRIAVLPAAPRVTVPAGSAAYVQGPGNTCSDLIKSRRTVRAFKDTPVPEEHLLNILDMARMAPTSGNQQPWKFLVVRSARSSRRWKKEAAGWYVAAAEKTARP